MFDLSLCCSLACSGQVLFVTFLGVFLVHAEQHLCY